MSVTKETKHRLLPCPFCGAVPRLLEWAGSWVVECAECGVQTCLNMSKHFARRSWNRRHVPGRAGRKAAKASKNAI